MGPGQHDGVKFARFRVLERHTRRGSRLARSLMPPGMDLHRPLATTHGPTDEELVTQLQAGEIDAALTAFEHRYGKRIFHFVQGMVRDPHLAQDVTQEVFEKVLQKHDLYRPGTN